MLIVLILVFKQISVHFIILTIKFNQSIHLHPPQFKKKNPLQCA